MFLAPEFWRLNLNFFPDTAHLSLCQYIIDYCFFIFWHLCLFYLYKKTPSFQKASALHCYNYNYNYKYLDLSHCSTLLLTLRNYYLSIWSTLQCIFTNRLTISSKFRVHPFSEVCLYVVVLWGLSISEILCNSFLPVLYYSTPSHQKIATVLFSVTL